MNENLQSRIYLEILLGVEMILLDINVLHLVFFSMWLIEALCTAHRVESVYYHIVSILLNVEFLHSYQHT